MKSKALYQAGWVSFSPFHRWEIRVQERFPTCRVHRSLWKLPPSIPPAAPQTQKPRLQTVGFAFLCWHFLLLEEWHLLGFPGRSTLVLGWEVCGTRGRNLEVCQDNRQSILSATSHPAQPYVLQHGSSARQNTCVGRQLVPKLLEESSSWPLVCSEVGWIDCAAVETQGQGWKVTPQAAVGAEEWGRFLCFVAPLFLLWKKLLFYVSV